MIGTEGEGAKVPRILLRGEESPYSVPLAWLPDGKRFVCSAWKGDHTVDLLLMSATDGWAERLKSLDWRESYFAAISPDGRFLAYDVLQNRGEGASDIRIIALDGRSDAALVEHPASDSVLGWAPDGSGVLFRSDRRGQEDTWFVGVHDGKQDGSPRMVMASSGGPLGFTENGSFYYSQSVGGDAIYTAPLDPDSGRLAGEPKQIQMEGESNVGPTFSPDGRRLAWLRGSNVHGVLVIQEESGRRRAIELPTQARGFSWFEDGKRLLVFGADDKNRMSAFEVQPGTGEATPLFHLPKASIQNAVPVQGGRQVIFGQSTLHTHDIETGEERLLASNVGGWDVSPDRTEVAYVHGASNEGHSLKVQALAPDAKPRVLADHLPTGRHERLTWSPDGKRLFFSCSGPRGARENSEWWTLPVAGGEPSATGLKVPGFGHHSKMSVHPDGRRVVYSQRWGHREVWVAEGLLRSE